jgi:hypothetical protein
VDGGNASGIQILGDCPEGHALGAQGGDSLLTMASWAARFFVIVAQPCSSERSGLSMDEFIDIMNEARAVTKERMASIKKRNKEGDKTKMAYFFSILEDRLGLRTA